MKILEVIQTLAPGGAERLVVDLCNEMSKTQDVTLLLLKDADHFYLSQVDKNVKVVYGHVPVGGGIKQLWHCMQLIDGLSPDVVHVHSHARYTMLFANIWLRKKYRFFLTIHSDVELHYSKGISGFQVRASGCIGGCKFITISNTNYDQFKKCHPKLKQKRILNGRTNPILSDSLQDVEKEMQSYRTTNNTTLFIHVARFHPCKNQKLLVEAFNKLVSNGEDVSLAIIGAYFDTEEGKALQKKACDRIHFLGAKPNVYDYLACADAFCLSSDYEGMPMSLIEAMLSGLALISTPVCGAIDAIKEGLNGFISKSHTVGDYCSALKLFIDNKVEVSQFAKDYKQVCPYTIKQCASDYIDWFKTK